jgi:hypothetical protein
MATKTIHVVLNKQPHTTFQLSDEARALYATRMKEKTGKAPKVADEKLNRVCDVLVGVVRELGSQKASGFTLRGKRKVKCWLTVATVRNTRFDIIETEGVEYCALVEQFDDDTVSKLNMPAVPVTGDVAAL